MIDHKKLKCDHASLGQKKFPTFESNDKHRLGEQPDKKKYSSFFFLIILFLFVPCLTLFKL